MAQFQRHFVQELTKPLIVRQCGDLGFSGDNLSDVIFVDLYTDGEPYSGGGTCAGACICPDGSTVALTGSVSGKTASVTLKEDCFAIPGQIGIGIRVTTGTIKTTVLKAIYNVDLFATNNPVDPGSRIALDVGDLINRIDAATADIPASDMASLMSGIAPTFSTSTAYPAGAYVYYSGTLYRFTAAHAAGSWTGTDATSVALGNDVSDLKSVVVRDDIVIGHVNGLFYNNGGTTTITEYADALIYYFPVTSGKTYTVYRGYPMLSNRIAYCASAPSVGSTVTGYAAFGTGTNYHTFVADTTGYCCILMRYANDAATVDQILATAYVYEGSYDASIKIKTVKLENVRLINDLDYLRQIGEARTSLGMLGVTEHDGLLSEDGTYIATENYHSLTTGKIPCKPGDTFYYKGIGNTYSKSALYYDAGGSIIGTYTYANYTNYDFVTIPANVAYVVFSSYDAKANSITFDVIPVGSFIEDKRKYDNTPNTIPDTATEMIVTDNITDGWNVSATDGTLSSNSNISVSEFVHVLPNRFYRVQGGSADSNVAFYNQLGIFISGKAIGANQNFKTPEGCYLVRWSFPRNNRASVSMKYSGCYYIDTNEGLLEGLHSVFYTSARDVIVLPGEYDVIAEYEAKYGSTYFSSYTEGYNGLIHGLFDRGLWLNNVRITFAPGAKVVCHYTGNNANVSHDFSAFAVGVNVEIVGLVLDASNVRYGIHPDFNGTTADRTYFIVRNSDLKHIKAGSSRAIGAGLGVHSDWTFDNCIFRSADGLAVVGIHNNISASAKSNIEISNCYIYGTGWIQLNAYSTSTDVTSVLVHGCSWVTAPVVGKENEQSADNVEMIAWNNETRSN